MGNRIRKLPDKVDGPLWEHAVSIATDLAGQGYAQNTIHSQLWLVARLSRWMAKEGLTLAELTPSALQRFDKYRWERGGLRRKCSLVAVVRHLRQTEQIPEPDKPLAGPAEELLERYREHLGVERGLARTTVVKYEHVARLFLNHLSKGGRPVAVEVLDGAAVIRFMAQECRNCRVGAAKNRVKGLRSLLRFLYQEGLTGSLVDAVPTVAGWADAHLPKGMGPEQVAQLLASCDETTVVGRRDRAILMLLARMGLRAGEVASLELGHFDWSRGEVVIPGKGQRRCRCR